MQEELQETDIQQIPVYCALGSMAESMGSVHSDRKPGGWVPEKQREEEGKECGFYLCYLGALGRSRAQKRKVGV